MVSEAHFGTTSIKNPFRKEMKRSNPVKKRYVDIEQIDSQLNASMEDTENDNGIATPSYM